MKRLGMLVPSSNTVVEDMMARLQPAGGEVGVHVSRLKVVQLTAEGASLQQFELDRVLAAAELLADAKVDLVLWNGTAASWLGFERDAAMVEAIHAATGIAATTAILGLNQRLAALGARRLGLVTPYVEGLERRIVANYQAAGYEIAATARADLTENTDYARISPQAIADMAREVARARPDAILILCTNLAGAEVAGDLSAEWGISVLDSVRVAFEHSWERLGVRV